MISRLWIKLNTTKENTANNSPLGFTQFVFCTLLPSKGGKYYCFTDGKRMQTEGILRSTLAGFTSGWSFLVPQFEWPIWEILKGPHYLK